MIRLLRAPLSFGSIVRFSISGGLMCTANLSAAWKNFNGFQLTPQALSHLLLDSSDIRAIGGLYVRPLLVESIVL